MTAHAEPRRVRRAVPDWLLALAVFLILLAVYVYTLLPGLGGTEDTPKFQYIGAVLGTPHDPGYPLYMIVSWAASKVPLGTLAYRINLLSAFWGATAAAFVLLAMRRLAVPGALAVAVALGLGLGRSFWEHSTYAEVYTQAAALTAAALLALLAWVDTGRDRDLYAAVAATSLAFGTHLIVVGAIPFFVWLVLSRSRWRVAPRVVLVCGVIVVLGVAQYSYVWIRTVQGAPYLEARVDSIGEFVDLLRGAQFANQTFKDAPHVIAAARIPGIAREVAIELGPIAIAGAALGLVAMWRRRRPKAILLAGAFLGPAILLSALGDVATKGIVLPALMSLWMLAGAGAAWLWSLARSVVRPRAIRIAAPATVAVLAFAVPATQVYANFADNNRREDTYNTDYFDDLFQRISGPTAFLRQNDYHTHHMLRYQRYVTRKPDVSFDVPLDPQTVAKQLRDRVTVYAFGEAAAALAGPVLMRPVELSASSLDAHLATVPDGILVVVAGVAHRWPVLDALGLGDRAPERGGGVAVALKGFGPVLVTPSGYQGAVDISRGQPLGESGATAAMDIHVTVQGLDTSIEVDGQMVARSTGGLVVATTGSRLWNAYALSPADGFRPPLDMSRRPLFEVTGVQDERACAAIGDGQWRRLGDPGFGGRLIGRIDNFRPFDAEWMVYLASDDVLTPRLGRLYGASEPSFDVQAFVSDRDAERLRARLVEDGLEASPELLSAAVVTRLRAGVNDEGDMSVFRVALGGRVKAVWGRAMTDRQSVHRAMVCGVPPDRLTPDDRTGRAARSLDLGPGGDSLFGTGWQDATPMPVGFHRVLRGATGRLLMSVAEPAPITLRMSLEPVGGDALVSVSINGGEPFQPPQLATAGWNEFSWTLDGAQWRSGVNDLTIEVRRPSGQLPRADEPALRVRAIEWDW